MIKVLRIINRFNLGGPIYNASYLTAYLGDDFETKLIGGPAEEGEASAVYIPESLGISVEIIEEMQRSVGIQNDRKALNRIRAIIKEFKPDIVHTHASKAGALGRKAAFAEKVPVVVHTFHGHVFEGYFGIGKTMLYKFIERQLARKSSAIIAISELQKLALSQQHKIAPTSKFEVIPLGFDLTRFQQDNAVRRKEFRNEHKLEENTIAIGIIGRLVPIKNHELLLNALKLIEKELQWKVVLFIIGDGELKQELKQKVKMLHFSELVEVQFYGWEKNIAKLLPGLDIVALSSINEGTPVSLIEAQAANIPVISTNVGGVLNVVDNGNTGFVVEENEVHSYAKMLLKLINNQEIREKMSQNGWNFVQQKFSYKRLCHDVRQLYIKLLHEKG